MTEASTAQHLTPVVRPATPDDIDAVLELTHQVAAERRWIGTEPGFDEDRRRTWMVEYTEGGDGTVLVVEAGGRIVGSGFLTFQPYGIADLGMFLAEGHRGQGLGSMLVTALIDAARARDGIHKIALQLWPHNTAAHALYLKHGFVDEGRLRRHWPRQNGELWDAIVMGLVLDEERPGCPHPG